MTIRQRAHLFHQMGKLLRAGVHVDRSVDLLLEQRPGSSVRSWLEGLKKGLKERLSVADAVARNGTNRPLESSLLAAGERGGRLDESFDHLARYYDFRQKSRSKALGALVYPLILLHLGLFVPDLGGMMQGKGLESMVPDFIHRLVVAWAILLGGWLLVQTALRAAATSTLADSLINMVPLVGGVRRHWALARYCQVFQTGLLAAMRIVDTLKLAGDASQSATLDEASRRAAKKVDEGQTLTAAMRGTKTFPVTFIQSVATAEETGTLDTEMGRWAITEAELAAMAQDRAAEWLPRIFYVIVVLYVASRILGSVAGYFGGMKQLLDA